MSRQALIHLAPSWVLVLVAVTQCTPAMPSLAVMAIAAALATGWQWLGLWRALRLRSAADDQLQPTNVFAILRALAVVAALSIALAYFTGARHDYTAYSNQWKIVLDGGNPWVGTDNAYGPLHTTLAWVYRLHPLLPKGLFSLMLVATGAIASFCSLGVQDATSRQQKLSLFAFFVLCPYSLITVGVYANNDILPAAAMVLALIGVVTFNNPASSLASGGLLALGVVSKFYPLIILPSLALRERKLDWAFVSGFLSILLPGGLLAYRHWGSSALLPLLFASTRGSKDLSIFHFTSMVLGLQLDRFSLPLMVITFVAVSWFLLSTQSSAVVASIVVFAAVLSQYRVGHQQFFLFFFLVSPFAIRYLLSCSAIFTPRVASSFLLWIGFLSWYQLVFQLSCGMAAWPALAFRQWGAVPFLFLTAFLAATVLASIAANSASSAHTTKS
jgi:hypothetical protein